MTEANSPDPLSKYREQHKHRLNYMPWLYWSLKPKHRAWAEAWQQEYQAVPNLEYLLEIFLMDHVMKHQYHENQRP